MAKPGRKLGDTGTRWRVLACLSDMEWRTSRQIADRATLNTDLVCKHLNMLERDGLAVKRAAGCRQEWCWLPPEYDGKTSTGAPATSAF